MARHKRKIVRIDEEKCTGCGECVPSCAEGVIQIIGGKARLVSDVYCDGLGTCLGHCPEDAITIIEREAEEFDEAAAVAHVAEAARERPAPGPPPATKPASARPVVVPGSPRASCRSRCCQAAAVRPRRLRPTLLQRGHPRR